MVTDYYSCLCNLHAFYVMLCARVKLTSALCVVVRRRRMDPDVLLEWVMFWLGVLDQH